MPLRTFLLVPAGDREAIDAARASTADAVVIDLTSAGGVERATLALALSALKLAGKQTYVRLSPMAGGHTAEDVAAALGESLVGLVYPKTESARDVRQLDILIREQEMKKPVKPGVAVLIPEIASPKGLLRIEDIVQASSRIAGIALDGDVYTQTLAVDSGDGRSLAHARGAIVTVCAAYGLTSIDAVAGDATDARALGFKAKYATSAEEVNAIS